MNSRNREYLHDSIFLVMDEIESRGGGRPDHPPVVQMRIAMNLLADDLGWNHVPGRNAITQSKTQPHGVSRT